MTDHDTGEALAAEIASELVRVRQRGLDDLDRHSRNQAPVAAPELERLAHAYCAATGVAAFGRIAEIRAFLHDALIAYAGQGNETESQFIARLFFDTSGAVPPRRPGLLLDEARAASGLDPERFADYRRTAFAHFAAFLIVFAAPMPMPQPPEEVTAASDRAVAAPMAPAVESALAAPSTSEPELAIERQETSIVEAAVPPAAVLDQAVGTNRITWRQSSLLRVSVVVTSLLLCGLVLSLVLAGSGGFRTPTTPSRYTPGHTYLEITGQHGTSTFTDPHALTDYGPYIGPYKQVQVSCKVYAPTADPGITPDGYWYRIAAPLAADKYYAPAKRFLNGDPAGGKQTHYTDFAVPDCPR